MSESSSVELYGDIEAILDKHIVLETEDTYPMHHDEHPPEKVIVGKIDAIMAIMGYINAREKGVIDLGKAIVNK